MEKAAQQQVQPHIPGEHPQLEDQRQGAGAQSLPHQESHERGEAGESRPGLDKAPAIDGVCHLGGDVVGQQHSGAEQEYVGHGGAVVPAVQADGHANHHPHPRLGEDVAEGHPKVLGVAVDVQHLHQKACDEAQHPHRRRAQQP